MTSTINTINFGKAKVLETKKNSLATLTLENKQTSKKIINIEKVLNFVLFITSIIMSR